MAKSLFDKAKKAAPAKADKKDEKVRIKIEDPDFFDNVKKLEELQDQMKKLFFLLLFHHHMFHVIPLHELH